MNWQNRLLASNKETICQTISQGILRICNNIDIKNKREDRSKKRQTQIE